MVHRSSETLKWHESQHSTCFVEEIEANQHRMVHGLAGRFVRGLVDNEVSAFQIGFGTA
jgi:hypothetical protein